MWTFADNPAQHRIEITFKGDYAREHNAFDARLMAAVNRVRTRDGAFDCLVDMSQTDVAPQDVSTRGGDAILWCLANGLRKGAFVHSSVTGRMQIRRLAQGHGRLNYFTSLEEAERWLDC